MDNNTSSDNSQSNRFCLCMLDANYVENNDNKWILCSNCRNSFHVHCVLLSDEDYEEIVNKNENWFCPNSQCMGMNSLHQAAEILTSPPQDEKRKCDKCTFVAKNDRGLKIHSKVHKNINQKTDSNRIETADDNEIVNSNTVQSDSNKGHVGSDSQNGELVPCLLCNDGKFYKKKGGLKIHCKRRHKNDDYEFMFDQLDTYDIQSLENKISFLKQNVRVLKRIPKGARIVAAYRLSELIEKTATKNDLLSWEELLLFTYKAFRVPDNNKKSLTKLVKSNIKNEELLMMSRQRSNKPGSIAKIIESKVADGDIRGAIKILSSSETLAKQDHQTYLKLLEKHPSPSRIISCPDIQEDMECLVVDEEIVKKGIYSFPNGSAAGIDGLLPQHLKDLIAKSNGDSAMKLISATTKISNLMLSGKVNENILSVIYLVVGVQQGDPSGPLLFSIAIHPILEELTSDLNVWYLDDGTLVGDIKSIKNDLLIIKERFKEMGLEVNTDKCEIFFMNEEGEEELAEIEEIYPGIKKVNELTLLGSAITLNAGEKILTKKRGELELLFSRLNLLNKHVAYYLLKNCLGMPKLTYIIRTMPMWKYPQLVDSIDSLIRDTLESICNVQITDYQHIITSLPCRFGGLGVRKLSEIMYPAFLSSVNSTSVLVNNLLGSDALDLTEIIHYDEALNNWNTLNATSPESGTGLQSKWDEINNDRIISSLTFPTDAHMARFKASLKPESSVWLSAMPSRNIGTLLNDNTFKISIALRFGFQICQPHKCRCGELVDVYGTHGLKCRFSDGRHFRHQDMNQIIKLSLTTSKIPATLEPIGLFRDDGKRPDRMSLIAWNRGKCLVWDATCVDTLSKSYIDRTKVTAGRAAEMQALKKRKKYETIIEKNYEFVAFAVETIGPWSTEAINFVNKLGDRLISETEEPRSKLFLMQNIGLALQRGNAASVLGTFPSGANLDELFYLI